MPPVIDWTDVVSKIYIMIQPAVTAGLTVGAVWFSVIVGWKVFRGIIQDESESFEDDFDPDDYWNNREDRIRLEREEHPEWFK